MNRFRYGVAASCALFAMGSGGAALALQGPSPGGVSAGKLKLPDGPASVRGLSDSATVSVFTGQVSYSVPIEVPTGPGGFAPNVALSYSGDLGNGPLGIGWNVAGISIRRSLREGVPAYDDTDVLELDGLGSGGRLIRDPHKEGRYWVEGQGKSLRVDKSGNRFEVLDSAGTRYVLGGSAEGREGANGKTFAWRVQWMTNIAGQRIDVSYTQDENQLYPQIIKWGPTSSFSVQFIYESRKDVVTSYRTGYRVKTALRLHQILVRSFGEELRRATLTYEDVGVPLSRLKRIRMTGRGGQLSLPELTFGHAQPEAARAVQLENVGGWVLNQRGVTLADVNGDGMADLARLEMGNHQYRKNMGGRFEEPRSLSGAGDVDLETSSLMDLDGDSRADLVHVVDDTWRVAKLTGETWGSIGMWPGTQGLPLHAPGWVHADINGDGDTDVIRGTASGLIVTLNGPTGMLPARVLPRIQQDAELEPGNPNVRFHDVNGDGLADVVWLTDNWMKVFLGSGDGRFVAQALVKYPWDDGASRPVVDLDDLMLADLNRDGLVDLVRVTAGHVVWYAGFTDGHFSAAGRAVARPENAAYDAVVTIGDVNGNGSQDVVWSSPRGMWALDLAGKTSAGMLESIDNGMGKVTTFGFSTSALLSVEADRIGLPWQHHLPVSVPVPVRVEIDVGIGPVRITTYNVRDGFWDGSERRFGGFLEGRRVVVADSTLDTSLEITRFLPGLGADRVLRGMVASVSLENGREEKLQTTETTWEAAPVAGLPNTPLARKAATVRTEVVLSENVTTPVQVVTTFELDEEARPIREIHDGVTGLPGDEKIVERSFASDDTTWVRDKVYEERVREGNGTLVSDALTFYGGRAGDALPLQQIGEGYIRRVEARLIGEQRWVVQTTSSYDACGNVVALYENGASRTMGYDARCLHQTSESIAPGGGQPLLNWSMVWDDVFARPSIFTDPNGDTITVGYDALGRPISQAINASPPHVRYEYDWSRPLPRTTTWTFDGPAGDLASEVWPAGAHWRQTKTLADGAGEPLFSSTRANGARFIISGWVERNERGQPIRSAESFYSGVELPTAPVPGTRINVAEHDFAGRVRKQTLPNGTSKVITYRALGQTLLSDELGPVSSDSDGLMRVVHTERTTAATVETVDARYDAANRILAMSLQGGQVVHSFGYDSLGRLIQAFDPDTGDRRLDYDDRNLLVKHTNGAGQAMFFDYDGVGRLVRRGDDAVPNPATDYTFIYDLSGEAIGPNCHVATRLAAVTEPNGGVKFCYDQFAREVGRTRTMVLPSGPEIGASAQTFTASGLLLTQQFDDGFAIAYRYDAAGRAVGISSDGTDLWVAEGLDDLDGAGRVVHERYGNQTTESYEYDALGLIGHLRINQPASSASLFELSVTRNAYGAPKIVTDLDGQGLDQNATFSYDLAGRISEATLGSGTNQFRFTYAFDALQNMTARGATGPKDIGVLVGTYQYGERGYGPRQLTSVIPGATP